MLVSIILDLEIKVILILELIKANFIENVIPEIPDPITNTSETIDQPNSNILSIGFFAFEIISFDKLTSGNSYNKQL